MHPRSLLYPPVAPPAWPSTGDAILGAVPSTCVPHRAWTRDKTPPVRDSHAGARGTSTRTHARRTAGVTTNHISAKILFIDARGVVYRSNADGETEYKG